MIRDKRCMYVMRTTLITMNMNESNDVMLRLCAIENKCLNNILITHNAVKNSKE